MSNKLLFIIFVDLIFRTCGLSLSPTPVDIHNDDGGVTRSLKIAFATGNDMKAKEMGKILADYTANSDDKNLIDLRILKVDLPEIQEINTEAIAKHKAMQGAQLAGGPCVTEDSSLEFVALGGMPGPYIKWFQETLGCDGLHKILAAFPDKSASAVCTLAFCPAPYNDPVVFTGITNGRIIAPSDPKKKGWDSIFVPDGYDIPFASMTSEQKNAISHRGKAVRRWVQWLMQNQKELLSRQSGKRPIGHKGLDFKSLSPEM